MCVDSHSPTFKTGGSTRDLGFLALLYESGLKTVGSVFVDLVNLLAHIRLGLKASKIKQAVSPEMKSKA